MTKSKSARRDTMMKLQKQKHFSFELDGSLVGREYNNDHDFAYAWYREEMKANGCNPDIEIEQ